MNTKNQRAAYGEALVELGRKNPDIVALDADLSKSTMSAKFGEAFPDRFFDMGIAEANMASCAAGLSRTGKIPFIHSFAVFSAGRAFDQIRQTIAIGKLNVKIIGSSCGLSDSADGATHQSVEDMAIMRVIPGMTVLCPADAVEAAKMPAAMAEHAGPVYMRVCREDLPVVTDEAAPFEIGKPTVLREGSDIVVFACGSMVAKALEAADKLAGELSLRVVNVSTIKPMNADLIEQLADGCCGVITAEDHSVIGGLGAAILQAMARHPKPTVQIGMQDTFGQSAKTYAELLDYYGLTADKIVEAARSL